LDTCLRVSIASSKLLTGKYVNRTYFLAGIKLISAAVIIPSEPNEAAVYQRVAGRIAMPILMDVLSPLYDDYPTLRPLDWED